jgi:putative resolvase
VRWEGESKIQAIKTPSGQRRYDVDSYTGTFIKPPDQASVQRKLASGGAFRTIRATVIYARVSSRGQTDDLDRQIEALKERYQKAEVVSEIGGGLNFKRPKLLALLERVMSGDVETIVVAHRDRAARFGFDWIEWFCAQFECKIVVLNEKNLSPEAEMVEDILAILHCFSSRLYGLRKYKTQVKKDPDLPKLGTEKGVE